MHTVSVIGGTATATGCTLPEVENEEGTHCVHLGVVGVPLGVVALIVIGALCIGLAVYVCPKKTAILVSK